jgi:hypothetical protein
MATQDQVREFLAHWFQLGKPVVLAEDRGECLPSPMFYKGGYSQSFEDCWHQIMVTSGQGCYLRAPPKALPPCSRPPGNCRLCPLRDARRYSHFGPEYLPLPLPRSPHLAQHGGAHAPPCGGRRTHLSQIQERLEQVAKPPPLLPRGPYEAEDTNVFSSWRKMS